MIFEMTYQVRVSDFTEGLRWYKGLLNKDPDLTPHEGFAEWELIPGCWLQVSEGTASEGSGPLRFGVLSIEDEKSRIKNELDVESFEIFSREEVPVKWATFIDPWGNQIGLFEYINKHEENKRIQTILGNRLEV
ncbi:VOC family protein [Metabacillus sp. JX24]|uniref:VOC family protein n=1 Tax=Metabacillus sp. JX24 TaxID=3240759 RepID=UPI00351013F8